MLVTTDSLTQFEYPQAMPGQEPLSVQDWVGWSLLWTCCLCHAMEAGQQIRPSLSSFVEYGQLENSKEELLEH